MTRVALDLLGGDTAPDAVLDGALLALDEQPHTSVVLVGPLERARDLAASRGPVPDRLSFASATEVVGMDEDPARAVRAKRDATVRVAARLVRDGSSAGGADAMVTIGSTGAALAAAVFTLNRLRGVARPPLAAVIPAAAGPLVFLDAGATVEAGPDLLASFALVGAAYARVRLGLDDPRVGLLTVGEEAGKGDALRKAAHEALSALPIRFVGNVEGRDVPQGGTADVVVTDGFTGNVLAKGLEAAAATVTAAVHAHLAAAGAPSHVLDAVPGATAHMHPDVLGGAVLLGVKGVVVVGHGSSSARGASCSSTISTISTRASESASRSSRKRVSRVTDVGSRSSTVATAACTTASTSSAVTVRLLRGCGAR